MRLAIVGAGMSGLAAAWTLRTADLDVVIFEKSRGYSGRAATRGKRGVRYDHGANYFKTDTERIRRLIHEELPTEALAQISGDVWTFAGDGTIQPGDPQANAAPKWTYRNGISTLGKLLAAEASATVHRQTRVERLTHESEQWHVHTQTDDFGPFDAVLLTPPAPQAADILSASTAESSVVAPVMDGLRAAAYQSQFTVVLGYDRPIARPGNFFALLNTDRQHDIAWLSFEEDKPGHVPAGQSVLIVQMAPDWTEAHYEASQDALVARVVPAAEDLLGVPLGPPAWADHQRWRYALPTQAASRATLKRGEEAGLYVAGDALVGSGRVQRALETGLDVAARIREKLDG